jgi:hypothetical protein
MMMSTNQDSSSANLSVDSRWQRVGRLGLAAQSGIVAGVVASVWVVIAPWSYGFGGTTGLLAVSAAAGVSLFAAELALVIGWAFDGPTAAVYGMISGMAVRMVLALLVGVTLQLKVRDLANGAMIVYLLVFYMITLAAETVLLLARVRPLAVQPKVVS